MEKLHHYSAQIKWTGNLGTGTSTYRAYSRNYEVTVADKPMIPGSSDPAFRAKCGMKLRRKKMTSTNKGPLMKRFSKQASSGFGSFCEMENFRFSILDFQFAAFGKNA